MIWYFVCSAGTHVNWRKKSCSMEACRKGVKSQFLHKWEIFSSH